MIEILLASMPFAIYIAALRTDLRTAALENEKLSQQVARVEKMLVEQLDDNERALQLNKETSDENQRLRKLNAQKQTRIDDLEIEVARLRKRYVGRVTMKTREIAAIDVRLLEKEGGAG